MYRALIHGLAILCLALSTAAHGETSRHYEEALAYYERGELRAAYIELQNLLKADPDNLAGSILLGRVLLDNGQQDVAAVELQDALGRGADPEHIIEPLGEALLYTRQYERALALGQGARLSRDATVQRHLVHGRAREGLEDNDLALAEYRQALSLAPGSVNALNALAGFYLRQGQPDQAEPLLKRGLELAPDNARTWQLWGEIRRERNDTEGALAAFDKALALNPDDLVALRAKASLAIELGHYEKAMALLDEVLAAAPADAMANLLKARLLLLGKESQLAHDLLTEINDRISKMPTEYRSQNEWIRFISGMSQYLLGNYNQALADLNAYYADNPDNFHVVSIIAHTNLQLNRPTAAMKLLDEHRDQAAKDVDAAVLLCELYVELNRRYLCETLLQEVDALFPDNAKVQVASARRLAGLGQQPEAIALLERANAGSPASCAWAT